MDAVLGSMRSSFGTSVRRIFSNNNIGTKNNEKNNESVKMSLCSICENENSSIPFIVRDVAKFIQEKSMKLEGIFRVSAPARLVNELRELYKSNANFNNDLLLKQENVTDNTGHAAAGLLKQFFRQLTEPLISDDVLHIFVKCKCLSDKDFSEKVRQCMENWPTPHRCTLTFLITFLHTVAQESENRMSVNGLAVVFGPNVFSLPDGLEGLQAQEIANQTFERLLSCSQQISRGATPPSGKQEPPPRPAMPIFMRPLPQTPQNKPAILPSNTSTPISMNGLAGQEFKPAVASRNIWDTNLMPRQQTGASEKSPWLRNGVTEKSLPNVPLSDKTTFLINTKGTVTSQMNSIPYIDAMPHTDAIEDNDIYAEIKNEPDTMKPVKNNNNRLGFGDVAHAGVMADINAMPHTDATPGIGSKIFDRSDSIDSWKTDSGNNTGELQDSIGSILDNSIRRIVQTRLFNSTESSSVSDDADSFKSNSLLPSTTAGRNRGPKNRRRPTRLNRPNLLNKVHFDEESDDEEPVVIATISTTQSDRLKQPVALATNSIVSKKAEKLEQPVATPTGKSHQAENLDDSVAKTMKKFGQSKDRHNCSISEESHVTIATTTSNNESANVTSQTSAMTSSVTTVMTPDSGCIIEDSDYPTHSSPIRAELAKLDIGRSLSPVFIPKLNLRNSFDEEDMAKIKSLTPPPFHENIPQLDLTSVTDSPDKVETNIERKPGRKPEKPATPPRPAPRQMASVKQSTKKKKRKSQTLKKTIHRASEVTPQQSDCDVKEEECDETMEQARDRMTQNLRDSRKTAGRPFDIAKMAFEELKEEKLSMQRELLKFESRHGRPTTKDSKQIMRDIYDRYRAVKRLLANNQQKGMDENENTIKQSLNDSFLVTRTIPSDNNSCCDSDVTHEGTLGTSEILLQIREFRSRRKRLRKILAEFESERNVDGSRLERRVMRSEYEEYKSIKTKLRDLEIALAKKGVEIP